MPAVPPTHAAASGNSCPVSGLPLVTPDPGVPSKATVLWSCAEGGGLITRAVLCFSLTPPSPASERSKSNEDLKQQKSELEEKLRLMATEKAAMQLGMEELQKKLEMSELLLQQVELEPQGGCPSAPRSRPGSQGYLGWPWPGTRRLGSLFWSCHGILQRWEKN